VALFTLHGSAYMLLKSSGPLREEIRRKISLSLSITALAYFLTIAVVVVDSPLLSGSLLRSPLFWLLVVLPFFPFSGIYFANRWGSHDRLFMLSSCAVASLSLLAGRILYPRIIPSSIDIANSLTIYNSSSTPKTLIVMLVIALVFLPLIIAYTTYIHLTFKGKIEVPEEEY